MMATALAAPVRERSVTVAVEYGRVDVEQAADSLGVALSDEEVEVILANIDDELPDLAAVATRSALAARIYKDLATVARGHAGSDDD